LMTDGIFCLYSVKKTHGLSTDEDPLISVELLVLKFIPEIHIQSDDEFKTVNGRETAKPHLNNPNCSKIGRLKRATPGDLVYPPVLTGYDLNRYFSVRPIWTSYLLKLTPPTEKEKKIWQKFEQKLYLETEDEEKRSIALDHPIVSDIGNFAVFTYNKACNMHVKMVEHNLHDIEFMECKYKKAGPIYYFNVTIEAIEEGNLGIYEAEVFCESVGYSRSLYKFNLTNRKPLGMKAMTVSYLSCLRSACKTLDGCQSWAVFGEMKRLRELHLETLKGWLLTCPSILQCTTLEESLFYYYLLNGANILAGYRDQDPLKLVST
ncbi:hypothetical protein Tco_0742401, partial [Tanacetum coccineum]